MKRYITILTLCFFLTEVAWGVSVSVTDLRTEQLTNPLGIDTTLPRLSWRITGNGRGIRQTSYHIQVASTPEKLYSDQADIWDSGEVNSSQSVWVAYAGADLRPNQRYYWRVKITTNHGSSAWSETAFWGMGPMGEIRWKGRWIGLDRAMPWDEESQYSRLSARYLRKEFPIGKEILRATVHICGLGLYEMYLNGQRVGDLVLTPAPTNYQRTQLYNSYDVTDLLRTGENNAVGIILGNGRYYTMRQYYKQYKINTYGYPKVRMNLIVEYTDGTRETVATHTDWKMTADGPIRSNNEYDGEDYDARKELTGWTEAGYNDSHWMDAIRSNPPTGSLRAQMMPGMRVVDRIKPVAAHRLEEGRYILDMGQNMVGWIRFRVQGHAGDTVRLRFAELLQDDGELSLENLREALVTDRYILKGEGVEEWAPRFTYHGFRYVEISGYPGTFDPEHFTGEVVNDDMPLTGTFESDNTILNQVLKNAWWGIRGNYKGMPVDCPQRDERQPWTGDRGMGVLGETFFMECGPLYAKWMDDIRESQRDDGALPDVAPVYWNYYSDNMTWPASLLIICDILYEQYGNLRPIEKNYEAMKRWMQHMREEYMNNEYILTRDRYGDWCMPPESPELIHAKDPSRVTDGKLIATAYYYKMLRYLSKFARLQSLEHEAVEFDLLAEKVKESFHQTFWNREAGYYGNNTVTSNLLPLAFDMVPEEHTERTRKNIIGKTVGYSEVTISSGIIGMQWLMRELARMGRPDVAYVLAHHTNYPGWGYMVARGATTIWELWNGDTADRWMNSCNHVMQLGDLIPFCYENLAGIRSAAPGFAQLHMRPAFEVKEIGYIRASHLTPYGEVYSHWTQDANRYHWQVTLPPNASAILWLPNRHADQILENGISLLRAEGVEILQSKEGYTLCRIGSGNYDFVIPKEIDFGKDRRGILADEFIFSRTSFPESHASTIAETSEGLIAAWFGGTKEKNPDCCIWTSRRIDGEWSAPVKVADGTVNGEKFACWNPVLTVAPDGELMLFYKVGADVYTWEGYLLRSSDHGKTWSTPEKLPDGFLGPIKNKPVYIGNRMICPGSTEGEDGWQIHFEITEDNGKTWRKVGPIEASVIEETDQVKRSGRRETVQSIQPAILIHADGSLQALSRTQNHGTIATTRSYDNGDSWTPLELTGLPNNNSGTDAVTLVDGRHLLVYNHYRRLAGMQKKRTPMNIALSEDGIHWKASVVLEDSPVNQYSYPSVIQGSDGMIHVVYTWRRQRIKYVQLDPAHMQSISFEEAGWKENDGVFDSEERNK